MNGERMNAPGQFLGQRIVDHAMTLHAALPFEGLRHDINAEVRLAAGPVARMAFMMPGFVFNLDADWRKR